MEHSIHPITMVVEDDILQRELVAILLEGSEMDVIQCESAEAALRSAALRSLAQIDGRAALPFTDVNLAGRIDGVELAHCVTHQYPDVHVVVTSGRALPKSLPDGATWMPKPWRPLDVLREAERARH